MTKAHGSIFWTALPLLAMAVCPPAHAQQSYCSNALLKGVFAVVISGQTGVGPTAPTGTSPVPRSGVALTRFDGLGGVTDLDHIVGNGVQPPTEWRSGTGTYTVNPDCTGKFMVTFAAGPPLVVFFVVGNEGNAFRGAVGADGANVTADGIKLANF